MKLIYFRVWWAGGLFHGVVWAILPPSDTVGGPYLTDMWPRPLVLVVDALCVATLLSLALRKKCLKTLFAFCLWPGSQGKHNSCHCASLSYMWMVPVMLSCSHAFMLTYTHGSTHQWHWFWLPRMFYISASQMTSTKFIKGTSHLKPCCHKP